jgi:hypothetical protein
MGVTAPRLSILEKPSAVLGEGSGRGGPVVVQSEKKNWVDGSPPPSAGAPGVEDTRRTFRLLGEAEDEKMDGLRPNEGLRSFCSFCRVFCWRGLPPALSSPELVGRWGLLVGDRGGF